MSFMNFEEKYKNLINNKEFYVLLLKIETDLKKIMKKDKIVYFYNLISDALIFFYKNNEFESCSNLIYKSLEIFTMKYKKLNDINEFLENFSNFLKIIYLNTDLTLFKKIFIVYVKENKISEKLLKKNNFFYYFSLNSISNKNLIEGYKFSIKTLDLEIIKKIVDLITKELKSEKEKNFFIARTNLEILINKQLKLSFNFMKNYIDIKNLDNNSSVLNFSFLLTETIINAPHDFDKFWAFINIYKNVCEKDYFFQFYLNKISQIYFNKTFIQKEKDFNLNDLMGMFNGIFNNENN